MLAFVAWISLNFLCLINLAVFLPGTLPIPESIVILLVGAIAFLLRSSPRNRVKKASPILNSLALLGLGLASYLMPGVQAGFPLVAYNLRKSKGRLLLLLTLGLPALVPGPALAYLFLYTLIGMALLLATFQADISRLSQGHLMAIDKLTSDYQKIVSDRRRILMEQDLLRENAVLEERNRIAAEIHDHVGHQITSAILQLKVLELGAPEEVKVQIQGVKGQLQVAMADLRNSVHRLHVESLSFEKALAELIDTYTFAPVHVDLSLKSTLPGEFHHTVLAIVSEALANTAKHSDASRVDISFKEGDRFYQLLIADNGSDVYPREKSDQTLQVSPLDQTGQASGLESGQGVVGIGLYNMEDRIKRLGGEILFSRNKGFRIFAKIPLQHQENVKE